MKKYVYSLAVVFIVFFALTACSNKTDNSDKGSDIHAVNKVEKSEIAENKGKETEEVKKADVPPIAMVDGRLYLDMGYINSAVKCGTADGTITSCTDVSKVPEKDDESNFGKGYEYQFWDKAHINININGKWVIFQDIAISSRQIPDCVANFKAKVTEMTEDKLLVSLIDIPSDFMWIFQNKQIEEIKPVSLTIENLQLNDHQKEMKAEDFIGKTVRVWFDGSTKNAESKLSYPMELGTIYRIILVEES